MVSEQEKDESGKMLRYSLMPRPFGEGTGYFYFLFFFTS